MNKSILVTCLILLLAGCATSRIPFPESELAAVQLKGDKKVSGRVFLVDQLEEEQIGVGHEVILEPVSSYSDQWYEVAYLNNRSLKKPDSRYEKYIQRVVADEEGKYVLKNVAAGNYYLTSPFFWEAITCSANVVKTKVLISKKITVKESDTILKIPLTKEFISPTIVCDIYSQSQWEKENDLWDVMK